MLERELTGATKTTRQEPQKTTEEERRGHKILRRSARLRALVERLDEIVRRSSASV